MPKLIPILLISLALYSCNQNDGSSAQQTAPATTSDPLTDIKSEYGGLVQFDKNKAEIAVSSSPKLDQMSEMISLPASHVAWLFYKNLGSCPYDSLRVTFKLSNGNSPAFSFPTSQLKIAGERIGSIESAANFLQKDDYNGLYGQFAPEVAAQMTQNDLGLFCNEVFEKNGKPVGFTFQGFKFFTLSGKNKELIHLAGMLHRERNDTPLSVFADPKSGQLYSIKFDY